MPIVKPKAPEYPRPVSPICADEVPLDKDTIVYCDQNDGVEEDEKERTAKRQRIETLATGHLRGQPVFILTAGLRGPFGDEWQNPWAKQKRTNINMTKTSHQRPRQHIKPTKPTGQCPIPAKKQDGQAAAAVDTHHRSQKEDRFADDQRSMLSSTRKRRTLETSINRLALRDPKTEGWLKTSETYKTPDDTHPEPSPPSPSERKMKTWEPSRTLTGLSARDDAAITSSNCGDLRRPRTSSSKPFEQLIFSFSSPMKSRTVPADEEPSDCRSSPVKSRPHQPPLRNRGSNAQPAWTDESRAECAIMKSKRTTAQPTMAVMESDSGYPDPADARGPYHPKPRFPSSKVQELMHVNRIAEVRSNLNPPLTPPKAREENPLKGVTDVHSASSDTSASLKTAQEGPSPSHQAVGPPSLEKETTGSSTTAELPSAQLPEAIITPSLPSNISSHDQMLRDSPRPGSTVSDAVEDHDRATDLECPADDAVHPETANAASHDPQPLGKSQVVYKGPTIQSPQENTKGVVNSMRVTDTATSTAKALRVGPGGGWTTSSPAGVKKAGASKSRKRQAFANEEKPSGSIKSALRVAKAAPNQEDMVVYKIAPEYGDDLLLDENQVRNPLQRDEMSPRPPGASVPRSILKASLQHSTGVSASHNAGSSSTKQDAQRQRMLNLIENDNFDLDGAINDLGSFLDTWDAEKHEAGVT
ncbi:hypothetical protein PV04_09509 [Phialophora macrospora]|uniref:Uncharacterized protein n=1 Tax=Phialophora macrospora TaxID=1851006 RepID=A0A0D2CHA0_9EURO|nr:hypothetical protein PV04_09509 [Phialophora macrospora]